MIAFDGAHVVVTGGTGALGNAVVAALRAAGAICHIPSRSRGAAASPAGANEPGVLVAHDVDIADESSVAKFYQSVPQLWGSIHLAGGFAAAPFAEISAVDFDAQYRVNARSCFLCNKAAVAGIRARTKSGPGGANGGRIVNVAARSALEPRTGAGMVAYAASKAAVATLTQALAEELAAEQIWVNAVAPSIIDTPINRAAMPQADFSRWVTPEAIAEIVAFLASVENRVTRGAVLPVYGGS
jgi:NAD(P)-dependent dehydrogenase (short-subunit alcohol dehydrogenase family)